MRIESLYDTFPYSLLTKRNQTLNLKKLSLPSSEVYLRAPIFEPLRRADAALGGRALRAAGAAAAWAAGMVRGVATRKDKHGYRGV